MFLEFELDQNLTPTGLVLGNLKKLFNNSEPQFPHVQKEKNRVIVRT